MPETLPGNPNCPAGNDAVEPADDMPREPIGTFVDRRLDRVRELAATVVAEVGFDIADNLIGHACGDESEAVSPGLTDRMVALLITKLTRFALDEGCLLD